MSRHRYVDRYADGGTISARRRQKAEVLAEMLPALFPERNALEIVDFGCADGAIPVLLLQSPAGTAIKRVTGITLLDYNDLPDKPAHRHPRFRRVIANLQEPLDDPSLPWGRCDAVLATAFFHYFTDPAAPLQQAARLLKPGGLLLAGLPNCGVLRLRSRGFPGFLPRNRRIRCIQSLDAWAQMAAAQGFTEVFRQAVQWLGKEWSIPAEHWLRRRGLLRGLGSNYLVVYRKDAG